MKKQLIIFVCSVKMVYQIQQCCPVKIRKLGFDIGSGG